MQQSDPIDDASFQYGVSPDAPGREPARLPSPGESIPLEAHRLLALAELTLEDRKQIVDQSIFLLEQAYAHRRHKLAVHGTNPILQLMALRRRLDNLNSKDLTEMFPIGLADFATESPRYPELAFHREMTSIFNGLRDRHTLYLLPEPFSELIAFLHFDVERARDEEGRFHYVVTRVLPGGHYVQPLTRDVPAFHQPPVQVGWEIAYWNGQPIERAIDINASEHAGSNAAARAARGLERLTTRPLIVSPMPTEAHVQVGFLTRGERYGEIEPNAPRDVAYERIPRSVVINFPWFVTRQQRGDSISRPRLRGRFGGRKRVRRLALANARRREVMGRGLDVEVDRLHEFRAGNLSQSAPTEMPGIKRLAVRPPFARKLGASSIEVDGERYGYLRLYSFNQVAPTAFLHEVERLVTHHDMPQQGLVIDVRGNGGGFIRAGESLLQLFTPRWIEPEPFQISVSSFAGELTGRADGRGKLPDLTPWQASVKLGAETGMSFSRGIPITSIKRCNVRGQVYYGPVVLIVDANCYSTTDIFAAGFKDHQIGPVIGIDANTGAGGANVWQHSFLRNVLETKSSTKGESGIQLPKLAKGADVSVAIRRSLRVGPDAGTPLEDIGVVPDFVYSMTLRDLFRKNMDLFEQSVELLQRHVPDERCHLQRLSSLASSWPVPVARQLRLIDLECDEESIAARVQTAGIDRLDAFVGGHWVGTDRYVKGRPEISLDIDPPADGAESTVTDFCLLRRSHESRESRESGELELEGYRRIGANGLDDWELVAVWRRSVSGYKRLGSRERTE